MATGAKPDFGTIARMALRRSTDCANQVVRVRDENNNVVATFPLSDDGYRQADEMVDPRMTALDRLIHNCPSYAPGSGFAELVEAARAEQAELIAALRRAMLRVDAMSYNDLKDPAAFKAAYDAHKALLSRFPEPIR